MTQVTLVYMTPDLEQFEGAQDVEEFESLEDLMRRAHVRDLQGLIEKAMLYYCYYLDGRDSGRVLCARPYDSLQGSYINDEITGDYRQADIKNLDMELGTLDRIREAANLDSVDELLKRALVVLEKVVCAREFGYGIGLHDPQAQEIEWLFDNPEETAQPQTQTKTLPGQPKYTLQ